MQLSIHHEALWLGPRLVVPESLKKEVLQLLHESHMGIVATKRAAREHFWYPGIDKGIENIVGTCEICQKSASCQPRGPLSKRSWPSSPFVRIHVDVKYIVLIVDAYTKWLDLYLHKSPHG